MAELFDAPKKIANSLGIFDPVSNAAFGAVGGKSGSESDFLSSVMQQVQAPPTPEKVKTLLSPSSLPTEEDLRGAKRKQTAAGVQRKGRASTVLTSQEDALGGGY